jgi:hypothetical protein
VLKELPKISDIGRGEDGELLGTYDGDAAAASEVVTQIVHAGLRVMAFDEIAVNLEDIFMRLTKGVVE